MSRCNRLVWLFVAIALCASARAADKEPLLKKVGFKESELDDFALAQLLKIRKFAGTYELNAKPSSVGLRLDCYQNGKKVEFADGFKEISTGIGGAEAILPTSGEYVFQIVDLDYLKLGDGKEKHWRMNLWIKLKDAPKGVTSSAGHIPFDVPKATLPALAAQGGFPVEAGDRKEAPLFWLASGKVEKAATVKDLLEKNKGVTILIGYLTFTAP